MMSTKSILLRLVTAFFYVFVLVHLPVASSTTSSEVCASYGYNINTLMCPTCAYIKEAIGGEAEGDAAIKVCEECCINKEEEKYKRAVLEVDKRYLKALPDIGAIVKMKSELKLKVKYRYGPSSLLMYKEKNDYEPAETLSVNSWSKDVFIDYLKTHLIV